MSRRIQTGAIAAEAAGAAPSKADDYLGRLVKYIPSEIVALYLAGTGVIPATDRLMAWIFFGVCLVGNPVYMTFATRDPAGGKRSLSLQVILASLAFPLWAFASGPPFDQFSWYASHRYVASLLLMIATFAFGAIEPKTGS